MHEPVARGLCLGERRQEPGRAVEELLAGVLGAPRLRAADRVTADEAARATSGLADGALGGADVGNGATVAARLERGARLRGKLRDRRGNDREVGLGDRRGERAGRLVHGATRNGGLERGRVRVEAGHTRSARSLRRERNRGPDQARSDNRKPLRLHRLRLSPRGPPGRVPSLTPTLPGENRR